MPYKNIKEQRSYQVDWRAERREDWIAANGPCKACGSTESLVVDHIDPKTKEFSVAQIWSRRLEIRLAELAKCQVLCVPCHKAKNKTEQSSDAPHGTYRKYKKLRCRCTPCREANAKYVKEYRGRKH